MPQWMNSPNRASRHHFIRASFWGLVSWVSGDGSSPAFTQEIRTLLNKSARASRLLSLIIVLPRSHKNRKRNKFSGERGSCRAWRECGSAGASPSHAVNLLSFLTLKSDLEDSVATSVGHLFGFECGWQEDFLLILLLVPLRPDVEDVVGNLDRQIIRSDSRQLDDHTHMVGFLEEVHR